MGTSPLLSLLLSQAPGVAEPLPCFPAPGVAEALPCFPAPGVISVRLLPSCSFDVRSGGSGSRSSLIAGYSSAQEEFQEAQM
ncbi:hypothetical protein ACLOJK_008753 [Asimina triloba]